MLAVLLALSLHWSSKPFDFYTQGPYDSAVPRPESILGYGPGERETTYQGQDRVVRAIAEHAKSRVLYIPYGRSTEGRELRVLAITSPQNMRRLDTIRADIKALASGNASNAEDIIRRSPAIVWVNECIHGNEPASFESVMWLLYNLAASNSPAVDRLLNNCVVILNPCYNLDGHERFVVWYNSVESGNPDPGSFEHREPRLVYGRLNHYRFDMNRDRVAMSQAETRQEVAEYLEWNPQAYADQHGQVSTYFFPPASLSVNANVDRDRYNKWAEIFGHATGKAFDANGFPYYVKDIFDLYYPGYLDSWTTLNGAIGMTHETDGGYAIRTMREDGSLSTLRGSMARHFTSALAVIGAVSDHREDILHDFYQYRHAGLVDTKIGDADQVVLHSADSEAIARIEKQLKSEGIVTYRGSGRSFKLVRSLWSNGTPTGQTAGGSLLIVPLHQPQGHLVKALFDPESDFEPEFVKEQLRRHAEATGVEKYPEADEAEFYDYTGWNVAYAADVDAWLAVGTNEGGTASGLQQGFEPAPTKPATFAYISQPGETADLLVADLTAAGVHIEATTKPIVREEGGPYPPGSFLIYCDRNVDDLYQLLTDKEKARHAPSCFEPFETSYPVAGRQGAGSESVRAVARTQIGVMFGDESSPTNFSGIWFALEKTFRLPFTAMGRNALNGNLSDYSCLIFPRGEYEATDKLKEWITNGGCAVVLGDQSWAISAFAHLETAKGENDQAPGDLPGSLFRAELDPRNFLCYGYVAHDSNPKIEIAAPLEGDSFYKAKPEGGGAVVFSSNPGTKKLLSGWEWPGDTEKALEGCVFVHDQPVGRGHVVIFMTDPTDRAMWPGLYQMLLNAIVLGPGR